MTRKYLDMNQHDALYSVARRYPGGLDMLAKEIGISANVLRNKLSPTISSHYPSFEEVSIIVEHCHKAGVQEAMMPLHALLNRHGMAAFVVPQPEQVGRDDLSQTVCRVMSEVGAVAEAVSSALMDGVVTDAEADLIEREFHSALSALGEWRARLRMRTGTS
ncbi:phage regulatory CII family protein [Massilia antarctica]|uniref:Phage regulatory CII family protein n=1 Tax=Massilia antarctica TaxID=2765360 RepID=A0AA49A9E6_9BURK|nr:phage regulatory CII family protein [Massilia antarctica]QPI51136.1 phage regulatory CII family protein [Massilia antarctica]